MVVDPRRTFIGFMFNELGREHRARISAAASHLGLNTRLTGALSLIEANNPLSQSGLGGLLRVDRTTVVQLVDRLEALGFVERRMSRTDRRQNALVLTPAGADALRAALRIATAVEAELTAELSPEEREALRTLLTKLMLKARAKGE